MQVQRHQRKAALLDLADQLVDFFFFQQQFAGADRVGANVRGGGFKRTDVHADDEQLAISDNDVSFLELNPASPDGLDLPSFQDEARLEAFVNEVIVKCLAVIYDAHSSGR